MKIDTANKFLVGAAMDRIVVMNPPRGPITKEEALMLAAYLVCLADPTSERFAGFLDAAQNA